MMRQRGASSQLNMLFQNDNPALAEFRAQVRAWLEENLPPDWRNHLNCLDPMILRQWQARLHARGWVAPHWPRDAGGMGASLDEQLVLLEEQTRIGAPYLLPTGLNLLGPSLIAFGTQAQKERFLPRLLSGEMLWAQGYSETEAGSDLAALRTTARVDGAAFIVDGHKIWSSYAHMADWMFALVRTDSSAASRQAGLSMLLVDLESDGVTVRPIRTIAGQEEFSEVRFDSVRVPQENLLGPLNGGWKVANHVLVSERLSNGSPRNILIVWSKLRRVARATGRWHNPAFRDLVAAAEVRFMAHLACYRQAVEAVKSGMAIDALAPVMKISSTELLQRFNALLLDAAADQGGNERFEFDDGSSIELTPSRLLARRASIYGGSNEIQRNIIAARVLGMPKSW